MNKMLTNILSLMEQTMTPTGPGSTFSTPHNRSRKTRPQSADRIVGSMDEGGVVEDSSPSIDRALEQTEKPARSMSRKLMDAFRLPKS